MCLNWNFKLEFTRFEVLKTTGLKAYSVKCLEIADGRWDGHVIGKLVLHMRNQHPELRSPVSDMTQSHHIVADEFQQPRYAVTDDRRPGTQRWMPINYAVPWTMRCTDKRRRTAKAAIFTSSGRHASPWRYSGRNNPQWLWVSWESTGVEIFSGGDWSARPPRTRSWDWRW